MERFIEAVTGLPELYTEFDKGQWSALMDSVTVMDKKRLVWRLTSGGTGDYILVAVVALALGVCVALLCGYLRELKTLDWKREDKP